MEGSMDTDHKDYAFKNEISLSIGDDSIDSSAISTPSTVTPPAAPTPSPRQNSTEDTKPLTTDMADEKKPEGIDNKAFEASEKPPLSSFGNGHSNGLNETANGNGTKNGQMSDKKLAEAVNLELININSNNNNNMKKPTTTNGKQSSDLPMKKDGDVEMGRKDDSYDEYFVPVNEHRKYMSTARKLHGVDSNGLSIDTPECGTVNYYDWISVISRGEKLFITKDKRAETRRNKLCWLLCIGIVAAVIILGICAASGVFSSSDSPVEARQFGDKINNTELHGAGIGGIPSKNKQSETTMGTTTVKSTTTTTEFSTLDPFLDSIVSSSFAPVDEEISYVPNSLEGQITLSNAEFSPEYNDERSPVYKKLIKDLENEIKNALSQNGNEEFFVKIIGLKSGSVVVDYRVSWMPRDSQLTPEEMMERIKHFLHTHNHEFMSRYHVNENTLRTARVPDRCASSERNGCDFDCEFNSANVDFKCLCPADRVWDDDWKECIDEKTDSVYTSGAGNEPSSEPASEPASEPSSEPSSEPASEPSSEPASEPTSEPTSEPKSEPASEPTSEPSSEPASEPSSEPASEPTSEPTSEPKSEPASEPTSEPSSEPASEPSSEPASEPTSEPTSEPKSEPASEPTSEPSSEPASEPSSKPASEPTSETTSEPKSEPASEPTSEPSSEPKSEPANEPTSEPSSEPASEPTSEPKSVPTSQPASEPTSEPTSEPKSEPEIEEEKTKLYLGEKKSKVLDEEEQHEHHEHPEEATKSSKPVIEEIEDIPRPTESFISAVHGRNQGGVNIFDMNSTVQDAVNATTTTIYSTTSPINLWPTENTHESHDMSPFLPETENSQHKTEQKSYSVTENVSEGDNAPHDQSPFLPESENKHILGGTHIAEESDEALKKNLTEKNEDSKIINIVPIRLETTTPTVSNESSTKEDAETTTEEQKSSETAVKLDENVASPVPESSTASQVPTDSTSTTTEESKNEDEARPKNDEDEAVPKEEENDENENIFGEEVENDDEEVKVSTESTTSAHVENITETEKSTVHHIDVPAATEPTIVKESSEAPAPTSETVLETTTGEKSDVSSSTVEVQVTKVESSSVSFEVPTSSTTEKVETSSATEEILTTKAETTTTTTEAPSSTTEVPSSTTEEVKLFVTEESTTEKPQTTTAALEVSTSVKEVNEGALVRSKIKLTDFAHPEDDVEESNDLLEVLPLKSKNIELTATTEASLQQTRENEVTEKTETTGNFLEQTTFPSVKSESDEASLSSRNGKEISDFIPDQQTIKDVAKEAIEKLFKPGFLETVESCPEDKFKCVYSNECISKLRICDGKAQCADHSDEWNCQFLSNNTNVLQVNYQDKILKVCGTGWTRDLSDKICQQHGFAGAIDWKTNANSDSRDEKYLVAQDKSLNDFEFSESCDDGVVEIECQEYVCGSNTTNRDAGEFSGLSLVINKDSTRRCSANIISPLWAITSAACINQPNEDWVLIAGNSELNMSKISKDSVISLVNEVVTYPGNEYALLHLKQVLRFSDSVYSVCLRQQPFQESKECLTTGWLTKQDNSLEKYEKIVSVQGNCTSRTDELCVSPKSETSGECYNDRGAALYCYSYDYKRWLLNGIQTQEKDCGEKPELFTSLTKETVEWIKNTVGNDRMFL